MPERRFKHKTIIDKDQFIQETFKTVPVSHVEELKGKYPDDYQAVVGKLKTTGKWKAQKVLIPKKNPDNPKPKKGPLLTREQTITIILAIIGIIVSVVGLYLAWKASAKKPPISPDLPPEVIPGIPRLWHFDVTPPIPSNQVSWYLPATAHVNSITGHIHIVDTNPGNGLKLKVGVSFWVGTRSGDWMRIGQLYPPGGMGAGYHAFTLGVAISSVTVFMVQIDRYYGIPTWSKPYRIDRLVGDALVVA